MDYSAKYRDAAAIKQVIHAIRSLSTRKWPIMEICGGQTHALLKYGIDELLADAVELIHGPGCPVCVTPLEMIDKAILIAAQPDVIFCSFGDMLRVPGSAQDLLAVKAAGQDIRIVYSPMDALNIAQKNPDKRVVFFAVGFETTVPAIAMTVYRAVRENIRNFSVLVSHVLVPPAMQALLSAPDCRIRGFLAAGHVCAVMGFHEYIPIAQKFNIPIVVTGFEPLDLVQGIYLCIKQLEEGRFGVENQYARSVTEQGNIPAQSLMSQLFAPVDRKWRGIGVIPASGLQLKPQYSSWDAEKLFTLENMQVNEPEICISGLVLQGLKKPPQCPAFAQQCTPEHPLGATMVSAEGACAAYYHYRTNQSVPLSDKAHV
ncbi:MAG TPA: hydrogenase formation protein HypD [bacterium]|nr:hydrogenase formation protein HypD [bacterium]HPN43444.1 hydrogenase formation protein HypD [bacterium]